MVSESELADNFIYRSALTRFGEASARQSALAVIDVYDRLGLPLPVLDETAPGTEGWLVFINDYGLVLRVETVQRFESRKAFDRINNDPDILQPLVTIPAGDYIAEFCPGVAFGKHGDNVDLGRGLAARGIEFWDDNLCNVGRVPVHSVEFPEGKPVVIDRLAVRYMHHPNLSPRSWSAWLSNAGKSVDVQAEFYAPLRAAFQKAVFGRTQADLKDAWDIAGHFRNAGKLLSLWDTFGEKTGKCLPDCGRKYAQHMKAANFPWMKVA